MTLGIRQFGKCDPAAVYTLRPGGYAVIVYSERVGLVSTQGGVFLPGGGQADGETAEAAAVRETFEECGALIRIINRIGIADELVLAEDVQTHFRKRCTFFRAELQTEMPGGGEQDHTLMWVPAGEALSLLRHESQKWAVAEGVA